MTRWLRRIRGALGMGVTWGVGWAAVGLLIGAGSLLGVPMGWFLGVFDAPLPALAVPGFVCGVAFSGVLGVAGRRRGFDDLSLPRFAAWGAAGGLLVGLLPTAVASAGGTLGPGSAAVMFGTLGGLSAASAAATLAIARRGGERRAPAVETEGAASLPPPDSAPPKRSGGAQGFPERASGRRRRP